MSLVFRCALICGGIAWLLASSPMTQAAPLVPGTGEKISKVGDDFEDEDWKFIDNFPKSSREEDNRTRPPFGYSENHRWSESPRRGHPDLLRRVPTPAGGIPGSAGALLIQTQKTGIPGRPSFDQKQDDLFLDIMKPMGGYLPASWSPSAVVRVYIPDPKHWEARAHASFGFRLDVYGYDTVNEKMHEYWPGIFFYLRPKKAGFREDTAQLFMRAQGSGHDFFGPTIREFGWWTLGISVTPDGMVHYYARPGVEDLRAEDYLASRYPYESRAKKLRTVFFNAVSPDNNRNWSTPWIIDDPSVYFVRPVYQAGQRYRRR